MLKKIPYSESPGKIVKSVHMLDNSEILIHIFEDGTYSAVGIDFQSYEDHFLRDAVFNAPTTDLLEIGIFTEADMEALRTGEKRILEENRRNYEKLQQEEMEELYKKDPGVRSYAQIINELYGD